MLFKNIQSNIEIVDTDFDLVFEERIQGASPIHFTPLKVAKLAARYLANEKGVKVLDIGSGAGKFCMIGSVCTEGYFVGVEQRERLHLEALRISQKYNLTNVSFINTNITNISFKDYDAFYIFNAFYENISLFGGSIDDDIELKRELYESYSLYVKEQLSEMPIGTKLVTYFSFGKEIPDNYEIQFKAFDEKLKMWEKVND